MTLMTTDSKKIFLDTNVLIYQTFEDFDEKLHKDARNTLEHLSENDYEIYISSQVLREFFAVATNRKFFKKPLSVEEAVLKIEEFENNFTVLYDSANSLSRLKELVQRYQIKKQDIHDANIVATMVTNDLKEIYSFNRKDFIDYEEIKLFEIVSQKIEQPNGEY